MSVLPILNFKRTEPSNFSLCPVTPHTSELHFSTFTMSFFSKELKRFSEITDLSAPVSTKAFDFMCLN